MSPRKKHSFDMFDELDDEVEDIGSSSEESEEDAVSEESDLEGQGGELSPKTPESEDGRSVEEFQSPRQSEARSDCTSDGEE